MTKHREEAGKKGEKVFFVCFVFEKWRRMGRGQSFIIYMVRKPDLSSFE